MGWMTGPAPGVRMEEGGLRKKKGCAGRGLLSSFMWSLEGGQLGPGLQAIEMGGLGRGNVDLRVVAADADYLSAVLSYATARHCCSGRRQWLIAGVEVLRNSSVGAMGWGSKMGDRGGGLNSLAADLSMYLLLPSILYGTTIIQLHRNHADRIHSLRSDLSPCLRECQRVAQMLR